MTLHPFDIRTVLLAKHAQHVVLIHFPIALYIAGVLFDVAAVRGKRQELTLVAYYNFCAAALFAIPALLTGVGAWQWALEGQRLKGILLLHLISAAASSMCIWSTWWLARTARRNAISPRNSRWRYVLEFIGVLLLGLTGHLGGFLSGVNGQG